MVDPHVGMPLDSRELIIRETAPAHHSCVFRVIRFTIRCVGSVGLTRAAGGTVRSCYSDATVATISAALPTVKM